MELSATGKLALSYAEEIFQLSAELEARLSGGPDELAIPFRVGIASRLRTGVPSNRDGTPMPIPGEDSALRTPLMRWLERQGLRPRVIAELDDSALMKDFGQSGAGVFPAPAAMAPELDDRYAVVPLGQTEDMRERFFAVSAERRLTHPAVVAVSETARSGVFRKAVG